MRKEGKSTRYALVCFYISLFAYSRARAKSFTRTFGKNFVFVLERGREKQISNNRTVFFIESKRFEVSAYSRRRKTKTNRRKAKMTVFIARRLFVCSRLVVVQIQTYHQTNKRVFLGELDFFLSLRKKRRTRTAFLPDLGYILTYFEGKKGGVFLLWGEKKTTKIHHRFKAS